METHIDCVHLKIKAFKCEICPSTFTKKPSLDFHVKTQHEKSFEYKEYPCTHCDAIFKNDELLENHVLSVHEKRFDFKCEFCAEAVTTQKRLRLHIKRVHQKEDLCCEICAKKFTIPNLLKWHKFDIHKEEMEHWICEKCPLKVPERARGSENSIWRQRKNRTFFSEAAFYRHVQNRHPSAEAGAHFLSEETS